MYHYSHITREFDGVECRLVATTGCIETLNDTTRRLQDGNVYEHVHTCINPEPTHEMDKYMIFVGGEKYENIKPHTVFGVEVHSRKRQHL